jgi:DNA replicative helicase MCM subunit Mcm2 (Cdc46/Mcm family)
MSTQMTCFDQFAPFYFNGIVISDADKKVIDIFTRWFEDAAGGKPLLSSIDDIGVVRQVSFGFQEFSARAQSVVSDFASSLIAQPQRVLSHLGLALLQFRENLLGCHPRLTHTIAVRFVGLQPSLPLASLKSTIVGKLVSITGYVVRCGSIQPHAQCANFECPKCGAIFTSFFEDGKYQPPSRCENTQCRAKVFELLRNSATTIDCQMIKASFANFLSRSIALFDTFFTGARNRQHSG